MIYVSGGNKRKVIGVIVMFGGDLWENVFIFQIFLHLKNIKKFDKKFRNFFNFSFNNFLLKFLFFYQMKIFSFTRSKNINKFISQTPILKIECEPKRRRSPSGEI
jgi:hypothetical protein